jgi:hypothetical protein
MMKPPHPEMVGHRHDQVGSKAETYRRVKEFANSKQGMVQGIAAAVALVLRGVADRLDPLQQADVAL